ncbi:ABC transporter transmembrane domain-containing protein [Alteromonas lipolytica]|uniref:ABC transporter ATP-binding protein n=1 Tax=Alteromonas lipolytica TaxID=1856405 RepID=A0A1E8FKV6_9ALTE|nr:ABC transporter ATP-binding protein [Alteromonas lipolytica]OFI36073.1 ABC transporter ATP-binding protein [Alteromonas lipolytica]GGF71180.1 ABC transporter ATP-binding protein [Alteromonas lipolytica]
MEKQIDLRQTRKYLISLLKPEGSFFGVAAVYGVAISLLTLAIPIAVQTLINSIANIGSVRAVTILAGILFATLFISGIFSALRMRVMEYYERRVFTRLVSQFGLKTIMAPHSFFEGRKNTSITHRYFDIMTLQKNIPSLMVDGFALVLQIIVGFTLVSFYHPFLFVLNMIILLVMYLVWKIWGPGAKRTSIELSQSKYDTAKWLNDIASAHEFFKSADHLDYAGRNTEQYIQRYISKHKNHFTFTFSQAVSFLLLYAFASATLLGLGGFLVVQGQLSIGQLVAAELIMSAVFFGISRFSQYLKLYYELYGAAEKIGSALVIPQEETHDNGARIPSSSKLVFKRLAMSHFDDSCYLDGTLDAGKKYFITTRKSWVQKQLVSYLKRFEHPAKGDILLGEYSLFDYDMYELRQAVSTLDRALIIECSIEEYLRLAAPEVTIAEVRGALEEVGLDEVVDNLEQGIATRISPLGAPLQPLEFLLLKLAAVILSKPQVLVINQHFDAIPMATKTRLLHRIAKLPCTVLYFTNMPVPGVFNATLNLQDVLYVEEENQRAEGAE